MTNNDTPWAERWPKPEFDHQGWEEAMSELSNMAGEIGEQARPRATRFGKGIRLYDPTGWNGFHEEELQ